ncbi:MULTISPECIES: winged helix-turn-helix transcriptional regulator [Desulfosediminicola]|uniref:winged helix-turn-helix transcriptional regulator n=1 Tax=Desulfosediminicola TaxID=2886823 RepID=UPI0010AD5AEE
MTESTCKIKQLGDKTYRCYFELTLQVIGGKWKPIILYQLAIHGVLRFGELRRAIPDITERMLTRQLRELEKDGVIHREVYKQIPPKVEYSLLFAGVQLIPVLLSLRKWGADYEHHHPEAPTLPISAEHEPVSPPRIALMYQDQLNN